MRERDEHLAYRRIFPSENCYKLPRETSEVIKIMHWCVGCLPAGSGDQVKIVNNRLPYGTMYVWNNTGILDSFLIKRNSEFLCLVQDENMKKHNLKLWGIWVRIKTKTRKINICECFTFFIKDILSSHFSTAPILCIIDHLKPGADSLAFLWQVRIFISLSHLHTDCSPFHKSLS